MALSDDEKQQLQALLDKEKASDDDDFVIAFTENGRTVEMPHSKGQNLLKRWGFDLSDLVEETPTKSAPKKAASKAKADDESDEPEQKKFWQTK